MYYIKQNTLKFESRDVLATQGATAILQNNPELGEELTFRHFSGDWGDVCEEERKMNERHLKHKIHHLMSVFDVGGEKILFITEWGRDATVVVTFDEFHAA